MVYVTAWTGFFFKLTPHCEKDQLFCQALEWSVAVFNVAFFAYCLWLLLLELYLERQSQRRRGGSKAQEDAADVQIEMVGEPARMNFENPMYGARKSRTTKDILRRSASTASLKQLDWGIHVPEDPRKTKHERRSKALRKSMGKRKKSLSRVDKLRMARLKKAENRE